MKAKVIFWCAFFGAQSVIAQTDSTRTNKTSEPIPCFAQCLDTNRRDTLCCSEIQITIEQIQQALIWQGFSLKVNGSLDTKTKQAWSAFMKEKGIQSCSEREVLQELGILKLIR